MTQNKKLAYILAIILILAALVSFFGLSKVFTDPETFKTTIEVLDKEKNIVAKMSAASFAAAAAIDLIPGDGGKSISEALVDLGGYFVLIFAAIYLEKILLTIGGAAAFKLLIPLGLTILAICLLRNSDSLKALGTKMITLGLALFLVVPTSVWVSQKVEATYDVSVQSTIEELENESQVVNDAAEDEDGNKLLQIIGKAKNVINVSLDKFNALLDNMIEGVAVFFVTTCVIPIIIMLLLLALINQLLGTNFKASSLLKMPLKTKEKVRQHTSESASEE